MRNERELPELVTAGPVEFRLDESGLRHVRVNDAEVVSAVYVAVRDANWGTVPARLLDADSASADSGFVLRWTVRHEDEEISYTWRGSVRVSSGHDHEAELAFEMNGIADKPFDTNRIGICLLHPLTLAGASVDVREAGEWVPGQFPARVCPHQPFRPFTGLRHSLPGGGTAEIALDGSAFEMEDQRNWTDASFKTYCPPLSEPCPRTMLAGERIHQAVTIRLSLTAPGEPPAQAAAGLARVPAPPWHRRAGATSRPSHRPVSVTVGPPSGARLPGIGVALAGAGTGLSPADRAAVRALQLSHLHAVVDTARSDWPAHLQHSLDEAAGFGCAADIEVVVDGAGDLGQVARTLSELSRPRPGRVFLFDRPSSQTPRDLAAAWPADRLGRPGGGSRANFAELNRSDLPVDLLSSIAFAMNPQVHAADDESVMETLAAQPLVAACARGMAGGLPVIGGPITLKPRFNAVATGPPRPRPPGALPDDTDHRQPTAFAAAWLLGSIAALAPAGLAALTYFETAGAKGLLAGISDLPPGFPASGVFPAYHVLALASGMAGRQVLRTSCDQASRVAALAVAQESGPAVILANLRPDEELVEVHGCREGSVLRRLPTRTLPVTDIPTPADPAAWLRPERRGDSFAISLRPWEVAVFRPAADSSEKGTHAEPALGTADSQST